MKKCFGIIFIAIILCFIYITFSFAQPKWLVSIAAKSDVVLTWELAEDSLKTIIYRKKEGEESFSVIKDDALGYYMDQGLSAGVYIYKLQSVDAQGNKGSFSEERFVIVSEVTKAEEPYTPPIWAESFATSNRTLLMWEDTCNVPITAYNLYKKLEDSPEFELYQTLTETTFADVFVILGKKVIYKVCPLDKNGKELECSLPISFEIKEEEVVEEAPSIPEYPLIIRKTKLDKFLVLPQNKPFISPTDIKVDKIGKIYVADTGSNLIHVFKYSGEYEKSIGNTINQDGSFETFENLLGIDVDNSGIIYGVDSYKGVIKAFNQDGAIILKIDLFEIFRDNEEYNFIKFGLIDICVDDEKNVIYIVDNFNNHVFKFNKKGILLKVLLDKGQKLGQIHLPTFTHIDQKGNITLSDTMNQRISVFNSDFEPLMIFGREGDVLGTFIRPKGVGRDRDGDIYVADSYTNSIQVFSPEGEFKYILGNEDGDQPDIVTPNGIYIDKNNKIYIVEKLINRIQMRQMSDQFIKIE